MTPNTTQPCSGASVLTPLVVRNRPGLSQLRYRAGTHAAFLDTMIARLSSAAGEQSPLQQLQTRDIDDPTIALLDAWSVVGDILTLYQERIANEGYLTTAQERRSIERLAQLVGYRLKPGLSASTWLAFRVDPTNTTEIIIPTETPAKTVPGQNELPQTFETRFPITARAEWNEIKPRVSRLPNITPANVEQISGLTVEGTSLGLNRDDVILVRFVNGDSAPRLRRIRHVTVDTQKQRTRLTFYAASVSHQRFNRRILPRLSEIEGAVGAFRENAVVADSEEQPKLLFQKQGTVNVDGVDVRALTPTVATLRKLLTEDGSTVGVAKLDEELEQYLAPVATDKPPELTVLSTAVAQIKGKVESVRTALNNAVDTALSSLEDGKIKAAIAAGVVVTQIANPNDIIAKEVRNQDVGGSEFAKACEKALTSFLDAEESSTDRSKAFLSATIKILELASLFVLEKPLAGDQLLHIFKTLTDIEIAINSRLDGDGNWGTGLPGPLVTFSLQNRRLPVFNTLDEAAPPFVDGTGEQSTKMLAATAHRFVATIIDQSVPKSTFAGPLQILRAETGWIVREEIPELETELNRAFLAMGKDHEGVDPAKFGESLLLILKTKSFDSEGNLQSDADSSPLKVFADPAFVASCPVALFVREAIQRELPKKKNSNSASSLLAMVAGLKDSMIGDVRNLNEKCDRNISSFAAAPGSDETAKKANYPEFLRKSADEFLTEFARVQQKWADRASGTALADLVKQFSDRLKRLKSDYDKRVISPTADFHGKLPRLDDGSSLYFSAAVGESLKGLGGSDFVWQRDLARTEFRLSKLIAVLDAHATLNIAPLITDPNTGLLQEIKKTREEVGKSLASQLKGDLFPGPAAVGDQIVEASIAELKTTVESTTPTAHEIQKKLFNVTNAMKAAGWISDPAQHPIRILPAGDQKGAAIRRVITMVIDRLSALGPPQEIQQLTLTDGKPLTETDLLSALKVVRRNTAGTVIDGSANADVKLSVLSESEARLRQLLTPDLREELFRRWREYPPVPESYEVIAFRDRASVFGHNIAEKKLGENGTRAAWKSADFEIAAGERKVVSLSRSYPEIASGQNIIVLPAAVSTGDEETSVDDLKVSRVVAANDESIARYDLSGRSTRLSLDIDWFTSPQDNEVYWLTLLRSTNVLVSEKPLTVSTEDYPIPVGTAVVSGNDLLERGPDEIECDVLLDGLHAGRTVVVAGRRADNGTNAEEAATIASVEHLLRTTWPGERPHTRLKFDRPLQFQYQRDTVTVFGNVAEATHGEIHREIIGSGLTTRPMQRFVLPRPDVSHLPSETQPAGKPELAVRVNEVLWDPADNVLQLDQEQRYIPTVYDSRMQVQFGDGVHGQRLPTGIENVRAVYRTGIGRSGNARKDQITQMPSPVSGVQSVTNPIPGSGGVDPESIFLSRRTTGRYATSLRVLISLQDMEDFALGFGGISKATAILEDSGKIVVYIAAADDAPLTSDSLAVRTLLKALQDKTQATQPIDVVPRLFRALRLTASVGIDRRRNADLVLRDARERLLSQFSFERSEFGRDVPLSGVFAMLQKTPGVQFARVIRFDSVGLENVNTLGGSADRVDRVVKVKPQELAWFTPDVAETIQLIGESP